MFLSMITSSFAGRHDLGQGPVKGMPFAVARGLLVAFVLAAAGCASAPTAKATSHTALVQEVTEAELAFATSMATRDFEAFLSFISEEAVFLNGGQPLRGKAAIAAQWKRHFEGPNAPFEWRPDLVEVLPSGNLAQSIGPVSSNDGTVIARFYSTWRKEADGRWRVVFDNGYDVCRCPGQ